MGPESPSILRSNLASKASLFKAPALLDGINGLEKLRSRIAPALQFGCTVVGSHHPTSENRIMTASGRTCPITAQLAPAHQGNDADLVRRLVAHIPTCAACTAEARRIVAEAKRKSAARSIAGGLLAGLGVAGLFLVRSVTNVLNENMEH